MAFEIYNGQASGSTQAAVNQIIDKLAEMWEWDSTDLESSNHSLTYGDVKISTAASSYFWGIALFKGNTQLIVEIKGTSDNRYTIVKSANAIMLSYGGGNTGTWTTLIVGTLTNINGNTGKGALMSKGSDNNWYAVVGDDTQSNISDTMRTTDAITQLIPYVSDAGGWYFNNAFRMLMGWGTSLRGLYAIGNDRFYISQRTAIKEE